MLLGLIMESPLSPRNGPGKHQCSTKKHKKIQFVPHAKCRMKAIVNDTLSSIIEN